MHEAVHKEQSRYLVIAEAYSNLIKSYRCFLVQLSSPCSVKVGYRNGLGRDTHKQNCLFHNRTKLNEYELYNMCVLNITCVYIYNMCVLNITCVYLYNMGVLILCTYITCAYLI